MNITIQLILEMIGTVAFAISGAFVAIEKKMDIMGVVILGTTTAVGGGILRDLILGITPPAAFKTPIYTVCAIIVSLFICIPIINKSIKDVNKNMYVLTMDAIGLGVFTVVGVKTGQAFENSFLSVFVGIMTGVGGGIIRDLFAGNIPFVFRKYFYMSASLIGAIATVFLWQYNEKAAMIIGAGITIILRMLAIRYKWSLPKP